MQKEHPGFEDMRTSPNRSQLELAQEKPLFKIKCAICEIAGCDGKSVIVDKPSRDIYRLREGRLIEICHVLLLSGSLINCHDDESQDIKDRASVLRAAVRSGQHR